MTLQQTIEANRAAAEAYAASEAAAQKAVAEKAEREATEMVLHDIGYPAEELAIEAHADIHKTGDPPRWNAWNIDVWVAPVGYVSTRYSTRSLRARLTIADNGELVWREGGAVDELRRGLEDHRNWHKAPAPEPEVAQQSAVPVAMPVPVPTSQRLAETLAEFLEDHGYSFCQGHNR